MNTEPDYIKPSVIGIILLVMALFAVFVHGGAFWLFKRFHQPQNQRLSAGHAPKYSPLLEAHPYDDLKQLEQYQQKMLTTYGWVDRQHGIIRIPIDRAIHLMLSNKEVS